MIRLTAAALLLGLGACNASPDPVRVERLAVPGTKLQLEMTFIPGRDGLKPFWISTREITWGEFDRFYEFPEEEKADGVTRPSSGKNYLGLSGLTPEAMEPQRPVTNLRYHSALVYCEWLSKKTGMLFRLPTDREWEAAGGVASVWQYVLEPEHPPDFGPQLRQGERSTTVPVAWEEVDPNRPFSTWWFRGGHNQGLRVVRVPDGDRTPVPEIEITGLTGVERTAKVGTSVSIFNRVTGEVRNAGDRPIDELLLKVYHLTPKGKPHVEDVTSNLTRRATFNVATPVLRNSAHPGTGPLKPGERRAFAVDVPMSLDSDDDVEIEKFGASVLHVHLATRD